ncbi:hypothetical protein [Clostridium saccharoperbutylacetonicum]
MKNYEMDKDYILEVLEQEEDRLTERIIYDQNIPESIKFDLKKLIAVKNEIGSIKIKLLSKNNSVAS